MPEQTHESKLNRRHALRIIGAAGAAAVAAAACNSTEASPIGPADTPGTGATGGSTNSACAITPMASELVTPTGSPASGYAATFQVGISI